MTLCTHYECRCVRAAELAAQGRTLAAVDIHRSPTANVVCRRPVMLRLFDEDGEVFTTLDEFLKDNDCLDVDTVEEIRSLKIGEVYRGGGGAAPVWSVERVEAV